MDAVEELNTQIRVNLYNFNSLMWKENVNYKVYLIQGITILAKFRESQF